VQGKGKKATRKVHGQGNNPMKENKEVINELNMTYTARIDKVKSSGK
jgi:hypothetical protein